MNARTALSILTIAVIFMSSTAMAGFKEDRPWLSERSEWSETTGAGGGLRGWWNVGNSKVFGVIGTGNPITTIHQITGPHIMHPMGVMQNHSAFTHTTMNFTAGENPIAFTRQTLSKVRGTNIVVMDLIGEGVEIHVYNYAPLGVNAIMRTAVIKNTGNAPLENVAIHVGVNRTEVKDGHLFDSVKGTTGGGAIGHTRQMFVNFIEPAEVASNEAKAGIIKVSVGNIPAGGESVRTQYLVFSMEETPDHGETIALVKREGVNLLKKTYDDWKAWLQETANLICPDQRLIDLLDDTKILVKIQTALPQYAAGPMEFFAGVWVRDSNGSFLYFLRMGKLEAARKMLEFYYRACAYNKRIPNFMPMDIDVTKPVDTDIDWSTIPNDPVEIPAWLIMQHNWYYEYTGDIEPIREHWGYLKRCLYGQLINDKGEPFHTMSFGSKETGPNSMYRFPHHGDETWIYPGFEVLNSQVFPEPNDHPHWDSYSLDSTWEFVVSAEIMTRFARLVGDNEEAEKFEKIAKDSRAAVERDYWIPERGLYGPAMEMKSLDLYQPPFPMVNFNALWIDYLTPDDPKAVSNVIETARYTMNPNFVTDATETLKVYVGMQPGMFLYNLAAINHPLGDNALRAMVEIASPSGEYTEKHVTEPNSYQSQFRGHRIRPWEAGINMDAAYYYLTGLKPDIGNSRIALCPRLPFDWKEMAVTGQKLADGALDLMVTDDGNKRTYTMNWSGTKPVTADFRVALPGSKITSVKVDGKEVKVAPETKWDIVSADFEVALKFGGKTEVVAEYVASSKRTFFPEQFKRERYQYVIPKDVPSHDVVYWHSDRRKGNEQDYRTYDYLEQKGVKLRILGAITPSTPAWIRPFLLKADGKINTSLFLLGENSVTNSLKYTKWWGDPELSKLFNDYMTAGGAIVMIRTGENSSDFFGDLLGKSSYYTVPGEAGPVVAVPGAGEKVLEILGLPGENKKLQTTTSYIYGDMVVFARPEKEKSAAVIMAKKVGNGFLMHIIADLDYEQAAIVGHSLSDPAKMKAMKDLITNTKPETVEGAFKDFSKDNAFSDDFSSYEEGSVGLPVWLPLYGTWRMQKGEYHQMITHGYDFLTTANARINGDYEIEAKIKVVENIHEGGFVFNMPSRFSKGSSQMVRFCGHENLWIGPFNAGGGFALEGQIPTDIKDRDNEFHTLKVIVRNSKGVYDIFINGKEIAKDLRLTNKAPKSGAYSGLVACRGHVAFKDFKIKPVK